MKKILLIAVAAVTLLVGCQSDKDKAEELIRKELNKVIVNFDTYEPIETVIDSAFTPYSTAEFFNIVTDGAKLYNRELELEGQKEAMQKGMAMWADVYTSFDRLKYNDYKEKYKYACQELDELTMKVDSLEKKLKKLEDVEPTFNGFVVGHRYRYITKDGDKTIGRAVFLFNKDFSAIEASLDLEDERVSTLFDDIDRNNVFR